MSSKKKSGKKSAPKKELKQQLSKTRTQLSKTENKLSKAQSKAKRWKKEATAQRRSASRSGARVEKLQSKLDKASAALKPTRATTPIEASAAGRRVAEQTSRDGTTIPNQSWTVVELRAEARARGLTGLSNKSKAQLLASLT